MSPSLKSLALAGCSIFLLWSAGAQAETLPGMTRTEDVIYGRKVGTALTMDVIQPAKANGRAIVYVVSGGWVSDHANISPRSYQPFLDKGFTVFAVVHGSRPKFIISEIVPDLHRAIRFIREHAADWKIDASHLGICGASAGGHLSLTMATQGKPGDPNAKDPVERQSSAIQAVACFFPPTDFLNYGSVGEDGVGVGTLKDFQVAFGPRSETAEGRQKLGREVSPIYFITDKLPPTLIVHGDADKLVPIQQAESFVKRAVEAGATAKLITKSGAQHGWAHMEIEVALMADWFEANLPKAN